MLIRVRLTVLALAVASLPACSASQASGPEPLHDDLGPVATDPTVMVLDHSFDPEELVVRIGTEVTWIWDARAVHDVSGDGFRSDIQADGTFSHTFDTAGSHAYVCTLHRGMDGTVHVVAEG